ncbi:MAG: hypothetical protein M3388_17255 [Acidobacteriota bacterium]|nr:hypothetical protein [Acidobacteriota bacterium]
MMKGCKGRVVELAMRENGKQNLRMFLAGLMDWTSDKPPTVESLANYKFIKQGEVHIKTITENNGEILGLRPLEVDALEPQFFLSQSGGGRYCFLQKGYEILRRATDEERKLYPVLSTWGFGVIKILAEKHFGGRHK